MSQTDEYTPNVQVAPYPQELHQLVKRLRYRDGWHFRLLHGYVRDPKTTHSGESRGLTLSIAGDTTNSYPPHQQITVQHLFAVPPATYNSASWQRWLFEQVLLVERHEAAEFFTLVSEHVEPDDLCTCGDAATLHDGRTSRCLETGIEHLFEPAAPRMVKPYAPNHGPGEDPYRITEITTDEARRTSWRGQLKPA
jgi:hypothetical protein